MSLQPQNPSDQEPLRWTCWQGLALAQPVKERVWEEILDGGQSFRWKKQEEIWTGIFGRYLAQLRTTKEGLEWRAPEGQKGVGLALASYLDAEGAQELARDALPWRSDGALGAAMARFGGLRILRQDPDEALLAFLCSSNKRIRRFGGWWRPWLRAWARKSRRGTTRCLGGSDWHERGRRSCRHADLVTGQRL
jgi:hypothetical protein